MTIELFARWADQLDEDQLAAAKHHDGPAKVVAAAGSGKSRMVVARIARLVSAGVEPTRILAVTFSKAGQEVMNDRLSKNYDVDDARVTTWHALALQIIKEDFLEVGDWEVDGTNKAKGVLKESLGYKGIDWKTADLSRVSNFIGLCKAGAYDVDSEETLVLAKKMFNFQSSQAIRAYRTFEMRIHDRQLLTFDDMLVYAYRHLNADEEARQRWAQRWDYVIQDEGQDASLVQDHLARLLSQDHRNYMLVGDPRQSLYGFRGSNPMLFERFEEQWPGATVYTLPKCYRSAPEIVEAGNRISASMEIKTPSSVAVLKTTGKIEVKKFVDEEEEAKGIAAWAKSHEAEQKFILYRLNRQSRAIEEALIAQRVAYEIRGSVSFYERKEVKDLLAYLRLASATDASDSEEQVRRCINAPFRFLGAKFVDRVIAAAEGSSTVDWTQIVRDVAKQEGLQQRQRDSAENWSTLVKTIAEMIEKDETCGSILSWLVAETKYTAWLVKEEGEETADSQPLQNVAELLRLTQKFASVAEFLEYVDDQQRKSRRQRKGPKCVMMSCHRSKGLEANHVWVAGVSAGAFPFYKGDPAEELRIFYVAVTRAIESVTASFVIGKMSAQGKAQEAGASRFIPLLGVKIPGESDERSVEQEDDELLAPDP